MGEPKFPIWMINKKEPAKCDTSDSDVFLLFPDILENILFYELLCKTALKHHLRKLIKPYTKLKYYEPVILSHIVFISEITKCYSYISVSDDCSQLLDTLNKMY